jgi:hypothetical protein
MAAPNDFSVQKIKYELKLRELSTKGKRDNLERKLAAVLAKEAADEEKTSDVEEIIATRSEKAVCTNNHVLDLIRRKEKLLKLDIS